MSLGGRPCAQGTRREIVPAVPLTWNARMANYARQAGRIGEDGEVVAGWLVSDRQWHRLEQKRRHHDAKAAGS